MYQKIKDATPVSKIFIEDAEKILGKKLYFELQKIKPSVMLDYTVFGYFDRCRVMNRVLAEFGFFKKFMKGEINLDISYNKNCRAKMK